MKKDFRETKMTEDSVPKVETEEPVPSPKGEQRAVFKPEASQTKTKSGKTKGYIFGKSVGDNLWKRGDSGKSGVYTKNDVYPLSGGLAKEEVKIPVSPGEKSVVSVGIPPGYYARFSFSDNYSIVSKAIKIKLRSSFFTGETMRFGVGSFAFGVWPKIEDRKKGTKSDIAIVPKRQGGVSIGWALPSRHVATLFLDVYDKKEKRTQKVEIRVYLFKLSDCKEGSWSQLLCANPDMRKYAYSPRWIPLSASYFLIPPPRFPTSEIIKMYKYEHFGEKAPYKKIKDLKDGEGVIFDYRGVLYDILKIGGKIVAAPRGY